MPALTLADTIREQARRYPERIGLTFQGRDTTFAEMDRRASQVGAALVDAGIGAQDRVAFLDKNGPEWFDALFGAGKANAVLVAVNWRLAPPEMVYIINDSEAKVLIVSSDFVPQLEAFRDELKHVQKVVVIGKTDTADETWDGWLDRYPADDPNLASKPDDICFQLYTSGTTGRPKGAMLTNANLFSMLATTSSTWLLTGVPEPVNMVVMPLFHIGGGGWAVAGLYNGCRTILHREVDPVAIVSDLQQYKVTHSFFVPAVLQFMLQVPGVGDGDYSSLLLVLYGASPISTDVLRRAVETFGNKFMQAYGLTETTGAVVLLPVEDHAADSPNPGRLRAAGLPMPGCEVRVVDPDTLEDVPTGEVGEVWARGGQIMAGYWKMPEETAKSITEDGWFRTGDAGYFDADGYLYIHDRVKDMIVSGGENVYPAEIENALMAHPDIADVGVIGVPDEKWGEAVKAMVVRRPGSEITEAEVVSYARERLAGYKCPKSVDFIDILPRNPSGKILKKDLREPFWAGRERQVN